MQGTIVNVAAVIVGSLIGLLIHSRLPKRVAGIAFQGIGLFTIFLGFTMSAKSNELLIMIMSIVAGSILGEFIDIEKHLEKGSELINRKIKTSEVKFTDGFITATLLFCVGSMAILGAIEEGLGGKPNLFYAKSILDGFSSIALAASLGIGVMFSAFPLLLYQGTLTILAKSLQSVLTQAIINELTAVGGLLLIGLGINLLGIKNLKVINMLPALLIAAVLTAVFG